MIYGTYVIEVEAPNASLSSFVMSDFYVHKAFKVGNHPLRAPKIT
jgi:hypothetical protein